MWCIMIEIIGYLNVNEFFRTITSKCQHKSSFIRDAPTKNFQQVTIFSGINKPNFQMGFKILDCKNEENVLSSFSIPYKMDQHYVDFFTIETALDLNELISGDDQVVILKIEISKINDDNKLK